MRPVCALLTYVGIVFLGGALLAPWAHWAVQAAARLGVGLESVANQPFHRYVSRVWMIMGLMGLWPFLRASGMAGRQELGLGRVSGGWRLWARGLGAGFGSLALVAAVGLAVGARDLVDHRTAAQWVAHLTTAAVSAVVVGSLEEVLFRGALFGALRKSLRWQTALVLSSLFYALVHFFQRPEPLGTVDWSSGLALLPRMMRGFGEVHQLLPGFLSLAVAGGVLGLAYQRTGNLFFSIGLHTGWVFWLKSYGFVTDAGSGTARWLWGSGKLIDGWFTLVVLSATFLVCGRLLGSNREAGSDERNAPR